MYEVSLVHDTQSFWHAGPPCGFFTGSSVPCCWRPICKQVEDSVTPAEYSLNPIFPHHKSAVCTRVAVQQQASKRYMFRLRSSLTSEKVLCRQQQQNNLINVISKDTNVLMNAGLYMACRLVAICHMAEFCHRGLIHKRCY